MDVVHQKEEESSKEGIKEMARYTGPVCRLCRAAGQKLHLKGDRCFGAKCAFEKRKGTRPGMHGAAQKKVTEYGVQLREKQKVKNIYGVLENKFYRYYEEAMRSEGVTGEMILQFLERRLDNVVFRLGLAKTRTQARQLVKHGHFEVNGRRVDIPSYRMTSGDVVSVKDGSKDLVLIKANAESAKSTTWLEFTRESLTGKVVMLPERSAVDLEINEQLIVEFYSK